MTTIALTNETIAADGMTVCGNEIIELNRNKIVVRDGYIFSLTGMIGAREPLIDWFLAGALPDTLPKCSDWSLVVISLTAVSWYTESPYPTIVARQPGLKLAFGAGDHAALGAMLAGASPRRAIELVAARYTHTGGAITEVNIVEALAPVLCAAAE